MKSIVVDTSALIRLYLPDGPLPEDLEEQVHAAWNGNTLLLAPDLILAEAGQVLWKKQQAGLIDMKETDEILDAIMEMPIEIVAHRKLLPTALQLARKFSVTVYDALFLALSRIMRAELITADQELLQVCRRNEFKAD